MAKIILQNLNKQYGKTHALKDACAVLEPGKIYGLLGRNGAGKTTMINIITNRIFATSGKVLIDAENACENDRVQSKIFCMTEKSSYPPEMRVKKAFEWVKGFYPDFDEEYALSLAEKFSLDPRKRLRALSTGYGSIFKLIATLASGAEIMIFDEPVLGLDANFRDVFYKELIANYAKNGQTIIISTHLIEEVSDIIEHVLIIKEGVLIADRSLEDILAEAFTIAGAKDKVERFTEGMTALKSESIGNYHSVTVLGKITPEQKRAAAAASLEIIPAKLQELFISMTS